MTSRERINTVMQHRRPDRVPVWCLLSCEHIIRNGTADGKIPRTMEEFIEAECNLTKNYGFDGHIVYLPAWEKDRELYDFLKDWINSTPLGKEENIFKEADPESWIRDFPETEQSDFYPCFRTREILGEDIHIGGWTADGYSRAIQWFPNLEDAMVATYEDPFRFKALVDYFDEIAIKSAVDQIKIGKLESIQISSPYAGSFISPDTYKNLVQPSVKKLANAITSAKGYSYVHTCGTIGDRLVLICDTEADGMECLDPPPLGNVTLEQAIPQIKDRLFIKGNIDSVNVLLPNDKELIEKTVINTINTGKNAPGGYILSTACSVAPLVASESVRSLFKLVEEYGQY